MGIGAKSDTDVTIGGLPDAKMAILSWAAGFLLGASCEQQGDQHDECKVFHGLFSSLVMRMVLTWCFETCDREKVGCICIEQNLE